MVPFSSDIHIAWNPSGSLGFITASRIFSTTEILFCLLNLKGLSSNKNNLISGVLNLALKSENLFAWLINVALYFDQYAEICLLVQAHACFLVLG